MAAVERIPKHGRNEFHHYDYATEADIVAAIRGELASRHIILLPGITGRTREPVGEKGSVLTHLDMTFTFIDGETGETLERQWLGAGTDKEDKGAYKAMTGGEKYFLLKTFLIPTGDDPEQDETSQQPQQRRKQTGTKPAQRQPEQAPPSEEWTPPEQRAIDSGHRDMLLASAAQHRLMSVRASEKGMDHDSFKAFVKDKFGYASAKDIPRKRVDDILKAIDAI